MLELHQEMVAMKITNNSQAPRPAATTGSARAGASTKSASLKGSSTAPVSADTSARVGAVDAQAAPSDMSAAKVNEISAAIASGSYRVNASAVADKLLANAAALAGVSGQSS
ncbi:MAG TPA: flagellar biosynthesis anti-sigma factor FlgM [Burkholderiaceae bacterium]|nr:flagellar biosynthesis anti-sigma factor FlgM [Burkholderiaceae bacterium]